MSVLGWCHMKFKASITIDTEIEAETLEDAKEQAESWQENMATSNDGSEMLANGDLKVEEVK